MGITTRSALLLATAALVVTVGAACGDDAAPRAYPSTTTVTALPSDAAAPTSEQPSDTTPSGTATPEEPADSHAPSSGAQLVLTDVRTGSHPDFDRVVFEFSGPGTPGWTVTPTEHAERQGSGDPITIDGATSLLDVTITGTTYPATGDSGVPAGLLAVNSPVIAGVFRDGTYEGITHAVIGLRTTATPTVSTLTGPTRLVVDVHH